MIDTLFIATNNENKKKEINKIFQDFNIHINIKTPKDFNDKNEPIEDGFSFKDNSYIKAKYYFDKYHLPTIGEDSGICIKYLNDLPGIHSKRLFNNLDNFNKNKAILNIMKDVNDRKATFHAMICYIDENGNINYFEGINEGEISFDQKGNEGFGYDPIFFIPKLNKTEAELGIEYKNEFGHRGKAFKKFIEYLKNE